MLDAECLMLCSLLPIMYKSSVRGCRSVNSLSSGREPLADHIRHGTVRMKKWNILVTGNDGKKFYQNFHVIEMTPEAAKQYLLENFPVAKLKPTIQINEIEEMEDAELFLPGVVYKSGKAYFNQP
jgi:hypothetical protein